MSPQENKGIEELAQKRADYIAAFNTGAGKRVLEDLEKTCFVNRSTYFRGASDMDLAVNEGKRFVVVHIKNMMNLDIETLKKLAKEGEQNV